MPPAARAEQRRAQVEPAALTHDVLRRGLDEVADREAVAVRASALFPTGRRRSSSEASSRGSPP